MLCPKTIYFVELSDMPWKTFPDKSAAVKISIIIIPAGQPILVLDSKWTMKEKTLKSDEGVSTIAEITRLQSHIINYSQCCSCIKAVDCRCGNETTNNMLYTFISQSFVLSQRNNHLVWNKQYTSTFSFHLTDLSFHAYFRKTASYCSPKESYRDYCSRFSVGRMIFLLAKQRCPLFKHWTTLKLTV